MCLYVDLKAGAEYVQENDVEFSGSGVPGICDLPQTSARNQMWVICKEGKNGALYLWNIPSALTSLI